MTKSFFGNLTPGLRRSSKSVKLRFLKSCVCTIPRFRWSRWPFTRTVAQNLDALQRKFSYSLFPPHIDEPLQEFYVRRHVVAGRLASSVGKWSKLWASDVSKWHAHVNRKHDALAWSPMLLGWRGHQWLGMQRLFSSFFGESRTNTRVLRGVPHRRWEEGFQLAQSI